MARPRIRTIKPEIWQDEKIGDLSRDARLLLVGLVTMADDEGRLRALPSLIIGHCFPYDDDVTPAKLRRWLGEIERTGIIVSYEHDGKPYIAFPHWQRHQRVNRPTPSELPPPPTHGEFTESSLNSHGVLNESSVRPHDSLAEGSVPHARARRSDPDPDPDPIHSVSDGNKKRSVARESDNELRTTIRDVIAILNRAQTTAPRLTEFDDARIESALAAHPSVDPRQAAHAAVAKCRANQDRLDALVWQLRALETRERKHREAEQQAKKERPYERDNLQERYSRIPRTVVNVDTGEREEAA